MSDITMTSKGQFTLPVELRRQMNLQAGDKLRVMKNEQGDLILRRKRPFEEIRPGLPKPDRAIMLDDMEDGIAQGWAGNFEP